MKRLILSLFAVIGFMGVATAADMTIYYSPTCPHCHHVKDFTNNNFIYEYPMMRVTTVDVTVPEHRALFMDVLKSCDFSSGGVPVIKIGEKCFQGFGESMADELRAAIEIDLDADAKKAAAGVKKAIAADGDKYRNAHANDAATVTEYIVPANDENVDDNVAGASDNKTASWTIAILAFVLLMFSVAVSRRKSKK